MKIKMPKLKLKIPKISIRRKKARGNANEPSEQTQLRARVRLGVLHVQVGTKMNIDGFVFQKKSHEKDGIVCLGPAPK